MKIFIPSYGRAATICTPAILGDLNWQVVVHDLSEYNSYRKRIAKENLLISDVELGVAKQRNWIIENLVSEEEWFCFMDDNIEAFWRVHPNFAKHDEVPTHLFNHAFWSKRFRNRTGTESLLAILEETRDKCELHGAKFAGFATTDNPFFRNKKWRTTGFVCTKTALVKKSELRFDEQFYAKDDVDFSAQNLSKFGAVVVNNYLFPKAAHHQLGGIGNQLVRQVYSQREAELLTVKWPDLCSLSTKREAEVVFKH